MNKRLKIISAMMMVLCGGIAAAQSINNSAANSGTAFEQKIDVGGYSLFISCSPAVKNRPVVVLEAGINQTSQSWGKIQPEVAKFARVCLYDRAGLGKSDPAARQPGTSRQIVKDLHLLLEKAGVSAPYVLVGHSFGGLNVRLFAAQYPKEVVGMVLVDSVHEEETEKWLAILPAEVKKQIDGAEGRRLLGSEEIDLRESDQEVKATKWKTNIPLIVLARGRSSFNPEDYAPAFRAFARKGEELRIEMQRNLAARSSQGKLIFAEKSGHYIHNDEPELVVGSIRRIVEASKAKGKN